MPEGVDVWRANVLHLSQQKGQDFIHAQPPILQTESCSIMALAVVWYYISKLESFVFGNVADYSMVKNEN